MIPQTAFIAWTLIAGAQDYKSRKVSNRLMLIGLFLSIWVHCTTNRDAKREVTALVIITAMVLLSILYWSLKWWGGADAKFWIVSTIAFPTFGFVLIQVAGQMMGSVYGKRTGAITFPAVMFMAVGNVCYGLISTFIELSQGVMG